MRSRLVVLFPSIEGLDQARAPGFIDAALVQEPIESGAAHLARLHRLGQGREVARPGGDVLQPCRPGLAFVPGLGVLC